MTFANKIGTLLKSAAASNAASPASVFQAIRCMSSSKLVTGGVTYNTHDMSMKKLFSSYGEFPGAGNIMDREMGRSRGFPSLSFNSGGGASTARTAMDGEKAPLKKTRDKTDRLAGASSFKSMNFVLCLSEEAKQFTQKREILSFLLIEKEKANVNVPDSMGNKKMGPLQFPWREERGGFILLIMLLNKLGSMLGDLPERW